MTTASFATLPLRAGSGKTAAFGLGVLQKLDARDFQVQTLVLCPTRELAGQVADEIRRLARGIPNIKILTVCGGQPFRIQAASLEHGAHIVVGTPGRIEDHLRKQTLQVAAIGTLVLDEADRMLDMGFQESLDAIVSQLPATRQTLLFSATYPAEIHAIATRVLQNPEHVKADTTHAAGTIDQQFFEVHDDEQRLHVLLQLLRRNGYQSTLIFCTTKKETDELAQALRGQGFSALALHGDLEQRDRDTTFVRFANRSVAVLVATDVAARGLDIDSLDAVITTGGTGIALQDYLGTRITASALPDNQASGTQPDWPRMETLQIDGGKKQKIRPGDILGALTGTDGVSGEQVGKISVLATRSFVAVDADVAKHALRKLQAGKLKGKSFRARLLRGHS